MFKEKVLLQHRTTFHAMATPAAGSLGSHPLRLEEYIVSGSPGRKGEDLRASVAQAGVGDRPEAR